MNKTIQLFTLLAILLLLASCDSRPPQRLYRVGIINPSSGLGDVVKGFQEGMAELGYEEGKNIVYLYGGPLDGIEPVDRQIQEVIDSKADLIYSLTTPATRKLKAALNDSTPPGVFGPVFSPVDSGIVESISGPGGRLTGIKVRGSTAKALEWLQAIVPTVKQIFIPFHITDKAACQTVEDLNETAARMGIELTTANVTNNEELDAALAAIPDSADALWLTCSHLLFSNTDRIVEAAMARNIPVASSTHSRHRSGVLVSYGENDYNLGRQVSRLADRMLKGADPASLPVESAEYYLGINLQAAQQLNITISDDLLMQADYIVR